MKRCILAVEGNQLNRELLRDWLALTTDRPYRKALPSEKRATWLVTL